MVKYAKPRKRTEKIGLRKPRASIKDDFSPKKVQKWEGRETFSAANIIRPNKKENILIFNGQRLLTAGVLKSARGALKKICI